MSKSYNVASVEELPPGGRKLVEVDYIAVVLFNIDGKIYAIEDRCTHDDGPLYEGDIVNQCEIRCPRHGARFDIATGKALSFPAFESTRVYQVEIRSGDIWVSASE